jgi:hypothetical protein
MLSLEELESDEIELSEWHLDLVFGAWAMNEEIRRSAGIPFSSESFLIPN